MGGKSKRHEVNFMYIIWGIDISPYINGKEAHTYSVDAAMNHAPEGANGPFCRLVDETEPDR
jgi:hypothetical protein